MGSYPCPRLGWEELPEKLPNPQAWWHSVTSGSGFLVAQGSALRACCPCPARWREGSCPTCCGGRLPKTPPQELWLSSRVALESDRKLNSWPLANRRGRTLGQESTCLSSSPTTNQPDLGEVTECLEPLFSQPLDGNLFFFF